MEAIAAEGREVSEVLDPAIPTISVAEAVALQTPATVVMR
jgi:hypothetical protein